MFYQAVIIRISGITLSGYHNYQLLLTKGEIQFKGDNIGN